MLYYIPYLLSINLIHNEKEEKAQRKVDLILEVVLLCAQSFNNHIAINNLVSTAVDGNFIISIFYMSPNIQVRNLKP